MLMPERTEIYVATEPTDFRKSFDGLCGVVRSVLRREPTSGALFLFRNRRGDQVKILFYDRNGYAIWMKRLDTGTFLFPSSSEKNRRLSLAELSVILEGVEFDSSSRSDRSAEDFSCRAA